MSKTSISKKVRWKVWLKAGGRCQYRGCNKPLWRDDLTMADMNAAYLAHIVGDKPGGPRGKEGLSEQLGDDFSNIMLLCDTHHRLIDREGLESHPPDLLRRYKEEHENRIERLTGIVADHGTHILLFGTKIGDHSGYVNHAQAREAVLPARYPKTERGIRLDLNEIGIDDSSPFYWQTVRECIDKKIGRLIDSGTGPMGNPITHLSVFGLAPIPALAYLGRRLGDTIPADVFQRHRDNGGWRWKEEHVATEPFIIDQPSDEGLTRRIGDETSIAPEDQMVAVRLSLSGVVHRAEVKKALGKQVPTYTIMIKEARRDFLHSQSQLKQFRETWMSLLAEIRGAHGAGVEIHLFPAVPNSVAIEIGRAQLPKSDPPIHIYDHDKDRKGFYHALSIR